MQLAEHVGRFPFGRPATRRPPRRPEGAAELFVLGVYPSALHVRWTLPEGVEVVGALAVDDEPEVFWDGADAAARITQWCAEVGWSEEWGRVGAATGNGSSGRIVLTRVLDPLRVSPAQVWFTDCLPTYFVKTGAGSQGDRIRTVYDPFAALSGGQLQPADLPVRPAPGALVRRAVDVERTNLVGQLLESGATRVVTLGQEAADVLAELAGQPRLVLDAGEPYGRARSVRISSRPFEWIPLTHPGNRTPAWAARHSRWMEQP